MNANKLAVLESAVEEVKRELREEYEQNLAHLDGTLLLLKNRSSHSKLSNITIPDLFETDSTAPPRAERAATRNGTARPFKLKEEVRQAVRDCQGQPFKQRDITERIREKYPGATVHPGSVSTAIGNLMKDGTIKVVRQARGGSDPSVYQEVSVSP
jgi:hypothetical protein